MAFRTIALSVLLALPPAGLVAAQAAAPQGRTRVDPASLRARVDSMANAALKNGPVAALSIAVIRGSDTIVMKGYGLADLENEVPATERTIYRIGSVTKQFTAAAVMQLVEAGKITLDDDITKYVPNTPVHGRRVTIRHLLNHTSGIPSYTDVGNRFGRVMRLDLARDSLVAMVANDSLMFEPGRYFYYNNTGYYLLGMLIEKVSGKTYAEFLQERLFAPLGMTSTSYCSPKAIVKHRAQGYDVRGGQLLNTDYVSMELPYAAGSLCSSVRDLVKWTAALASGRVIKPESYRQMITPVPLASGRRMTYGFGLGIGELEGHRIISHGGGINGFISQLSHYPDDSLTIAVLANTAPAPSDRLASDIARAAFGLPVARPQPVQTVLPTPAALRARFVGEYSIVQPDGSHKRISVIEEGETLKLQQEGQPALLLHRQSDTTFTIATMPGMRVNFDVRDGNAVGFQLERGARSLEAVRR